MKKQQLESDLLLSLTNLIKDDPFNKTFLLGVSGGSDSICLANLFFNCGLSFSIAHVNYKLRGTESDLDMAFVVSWSKSKNVNYYLSEIDTRVLLSSNGGNMQEVARNIRYSFYEEIKCKHNIDFICTAHHASDWLETIVFNFFRGGFLNALVGMPQKNNHVLRPLLYVDKSSIDDYLKEMDISYRIDKSNHKTVYNRNLIRHKVLPVLSKMNHGIISTFLKNKRIWEELIFIKNEFIEKERLRIITNISENEFLIQLKELEKCKAPGTFLYELLSPLGFTSGMILEFNERAKKKIKNGTVFIQSEWKIIKREHYFRFIKTSELPIESSPLIIISPGEYTFLKSRSISIQWVKDLPTNLNRGKDIIYVDAKYIVFPLTIRKWIAGDFFYPLNMNNQRKKVKDYLTDKKVDKFDKQQIYVLVNADGKIIWIVGFRQDNRFRVEPNSEQILIFEHKKI